MRTKLLCEGRSREDALTLKMLWVPKGSPKHLGGKSVCQCIEQKFSTVQCLSTAVYLEGDKVLSEWLEFC